MSSLLSHESIREVKERYKNSVPNFLKDIIKENEEQAKKLKVPK